jgi:hypothetical protein
VIFGACVCSDDQRRHRCNAVVGIRTLERKIFCATREALKSLDHLQVLQPCGPRLWRRFHDRGGLAWTFPLPHPRALPPPNKRLEACWQGSTTFPIGHPSASARSLWKHGSDGHALADDELMMLRALRCTIFTTLPWPGRQRPCPFCTGVLVPFAGSC